MQRKNVNSEHEALRSGVRAFVEKEITPAHLRVGDGRQEVTAEIGMSEPGAGSDLKGIRTMARSDRGGGEAASCLRARNRSLPMATTPT